VLGPVPPLFQHLCKNGAGGDRLEAARIALPVREKAPT
jgi:hypothetical protein